MIASASGHPQYSGTFIPEIWSTKLLVKFYSACVLADISNTEYEGEVKYGDKVIIRTVPTITIRDYAKGQTLVIQRPESPNVELPIDKAKYFDFICDDIDKKQSDIRLMNSWSDDAGQQMAIAIDTGILADIYADAHASNKGASAGAISGNIDMGASGAPVGLSKTNILESMVDCRTVLGEQNVPKNSRYFVMPEWASGMIMKSDLKDASLTGDGTSVMRNGKLGTIAEFTLYESNLLTSETDSGGETAFHFIVGQKSALTFAAQMDKMSSLEAESTFGTIVRGLNVYGYEVIKSEALIDLYAYNFDV